MKRAAMTLLELLCATLLATLLMVAVLGVVAGLATTERVLARTEPRPAWSHRVAALLAQDLRAADSVEPLPHGLRMVGLGGRDPRSGRPNWTAATIEYRISPSPLGPTLVRIASSPPGSPPSTPQTFPLVFNAQSLLVTAAETPLQLLENLPPFVNGVLDGRSVPQRLRLAVIDVAGRVVLDEEVVVQ